MLEVLEVLTVVVVGLLVGVELSVAVVVNPILAGLPDDSAQRGRAHGARMLGALMPVWYVGSLVLSAVWAVVAWQQPGARLVVVAAALLIVSVLMSVLLLVPINNRARTWTVENRPEDWEEQTNRWDRYHYVRVGIIVAAFALLATALA